MRRIFVFVLLAAVLPAAAQEKKLNCNESNRANRGWACEMHEFPLGTLRALDVDGGMNGGISVQGADRQDVLVRARVEAAAGTDAEAQSIAGQVRVETGGAKVRTDGPRNLRSNQWWAVAFEIFVPRSMDLSLRTHNGGLRIADVKGAIQFEGVNGGVTIQRLGGNVHGRDVNGGFRVELAGDRWDGEGLDVETTNGGMSVSVPANYSARLEASTTNGGIHVSFPVTVQGDMHRHLSATLGAGGAPIKFATTNGGITIRKM